MSSSDDLNRAKLKRLLQSGGVWRTRPVADCPRTQLEKWQVYEVDGGGRHLVGWSIEDAAGRVTSAIVRADPAMGECHTKSGRVYQLLGRPNFDPDADYVWSRWREINRITSWVDVSEEVADEIVRAQGLGGLR